MQISAAFFAVYFQNQAAHHEKRQLIAAFSRILPLALERLILTSWNGIGVFSPASSG
jgi:hypothetical protein